jgi:hypothetical protein
MHQIVREPLADVARSAPSTKLHRYYAAERVRRRMNSGGSTHLLLIKANAATD